MMQEIMLQRKLQKAIWCGKGSCATIHERWDGLRNEIIKKSQPEITEMVKAITYGQHNIFGYPNEERGLWLEIKGNKNRQYYQKKKADILYFVGCKTSFLIPEHLHALSVLNELTDKGVNFAVLGDSEWCCGMPLKRLGMNEEFESCRQHNLHEIQKLEAKQVIFNCYSCYSVWQKEYRLERVEMIYRETNN